MAFDSNVELVKSYTAGRLTSKSKEQYDRKVSIFDMWMLREFPNIDMAGELDYSRIDREILSAFVVYISTKRDVNLITGENPDGNLEPIQYQSLSYVSGYKSAIKYAYRNKGLVVTTEVDIMFHDVLVGYKRFLSWQQGV
jgi:hypothetical protein